MNIYLLLKWAHILSSVVLVGIGFGMASVGGYNLTQPWLLGSYALFILAGLTWLPVVWLQIKMTKIAQFAMNNNVEISAQYWRYARIWTVLGMIAFPSTIIIFWLMVFKPLG
jgi:uncharacterized membrane protein